MNNANILFPLNTTISMKQTGSDDQKYWLAPNGTQWLCGTNLWPWLLPQWIGRCILGFPWAQDHVCSNSDMTPSTLPRIQAWWSKRSVFHWSDHLAAISVPSVGLEDVTTQIKAFTKFTQQALNDSNQAMSLLNYEISMMKKKQYYKTHGSQYLYSISKRQAVIQTECCILIPDESSNITHLMTHMKNLISALSDLLPSLGGLLRSWFSSQSSCTNLYCGLINVISCITYILYKVVVSCITQCVTRSSRKLMMAQRLEATDHVYIPIQGLPRWLSGKESTCNAGDVGLILELRRSPGEWNGNPL